MTPWKILAFTAIAKRGVGVVRLEEILAFIIPLVRVASWRVVRLGLSLRGRRAFRFRGGFFCVLALASLLGSKGLACGSPLFRFMSLRLSWITPSLIP